MTSARTIAIAIALMAPTPATAAPAKLVDLDHDDGAAWRLAEAAGACDPSLPAFIRTWCHTKHPSKPAFTRRYEVTALPVAKGIVSIVVPVAQYGKGFVAALATPKVTCSGTTCMPAATVVVRVRTTAAAADVAAVAARFSVAGMWRDHQWWGPTLAAVTVELFDATGKKIGEGPLAP
jgi:acetaldehyde dehydrogenase (acetylating)